VASTRYLETAAESPHRGRYFDVMEFEQYVHRNQTPNTPATSLLYATARQIEDIAAETMEHRWERHAAMARTMYEWVAATREKTGIPLCVQALEGERSPTVTCVSLPLHISGEQVVQATRRRGFVIGGGYGKLKAHAFRIGHMGDHTVEGLNACLEAVCEALLAVAQGHD
jgi:aspartate aminotransferase-like enzyme